jgi:hypothetical protein
MSAPTSSAPFDACVMWLSFWMRLLQPLRLHQLLNLWLWFQLPLWLK